MINKLTSYIKESIEELKKVTWPTRKETIRLTSVVVVVSAIVSLYLGVLDFIFSQFLKVVVAK